jgi:hypothetical protein
VSLLTVTDSSPATTTHLLLGSVHQTKLVACVDDRERHAGVECINYLPLIETALYGCSGHVLSLLRSSPSPRRLVDAALLPTRVRTATTTHLLLGSVHQTKLVACVDDRERHAGVEYTAAPATSSLSYALRLRLDVWSTPPSCRPCSTLRIAASICRATCIKPAIRMAVVALSSPLRSRIPTGSPGFTVLPPAH